MAGVRHAVRAVIIGWPTRFGRACAARPRALLTGWTAGLLALAAGTGALWHDDREHAKTDESRAAAVQAARRHVAEVLSYDHRTIEDDLSRARGGLTGKFRDDFTKLTTQLVMPTARQDQITTKATVQFGGVISATPARVETLLFVSQSTTSKTYKEPKVDGSRLKVTMRRQDGRWLISDLKPL